MFAAITGALCGRPPSISTRPSGVATSTALSPWVPTYQLSPCRRNGACASFQAGQLLQVIGVVSVVAAAAASSRVVSMENSGAGEPGLSRVPVARGDPFKPAQ